ncbi:hypothetical protein BDR03DRAFT_1007139 [Suillus americanus]|nr:hypothetical protein BDR03DRAFT_1007139 [Suillus americanus]
MGAPAEDAGDGHPLAEASAPAGRLQDHASTIPPPGVPDAGDRRLLAEMSPLTDGHLQDDAIHPGPDMHPELHMQEMDAYGQPFFPTTPFQHPYPSSSVGDFQLTSIHTGKLFHDSALQAHAHSEINVEGTVTSDELTPVNIGLDVYRKDVGRDKQVHGCRSHDESKCTPYD